MTSKENKRCPESINCKDKGKVDFCSVTCLREEKSATNYCSELLISGKDKRTIVKGE